MNPHQLLLSLEVTPDQVLVHYRVVNGGPHPLYVRNVYRDNSAPSPAAASWTEPPRVAAPPRGTPPPAPLKPQWIVAGRVNLHPVGTTVLMAHTSDYYPVYTPFYEHPNLLWCTLVRPNEARDYTIRLARPVQQYEMFGGDVRAPAVFVKRAVLRLEYSEGGSHPEVDGYPGLFQVASNSCLSAGVDLEEPLAVHPMVHSPGNPDASAHPPGVPWSAAGLPSAELAKRIWDQRYGVFE